MPSVPPNPRYNNALSEEGIERIHILLSAVERLPEPTPSRVLTERAGLDRREGMGALYMCEVEGLCYATAGLRNQLLWNSGTRPPTLEPPPRVQAVLSKYVLLGRTLQRSGGAAIGTDLLMSEARFIERADIGRPDAVTGNSNERHYALGALKVLLVLGVVGVSYFGEGARAPQWHWIASD
jgi:hypothetical protein